MLGSGLVLLAFGSAAVVTLPLELPPMLGVLAVWLMLGSRELVRLHRVYGRCSGYRLRADGAIDVLGEDGCHRPARVAAGTLVTERWAWFRIEDGDGERWGELLAGDARESEHWRRFQVIFRHLPAC